MEFGGIMFFFFATLGVIAAGALFMQKTTTDSSANGGGSGDDTQNSSSAMIGSKTALVYIAPKVQRLPVNVACVPASFCKNNSLSVTVVSNSTSSPQSLLLSSSPTPKPVIFVTRGSQDFIFQPNAQPKSTVTLYCSGGGICLPDLPLLQNNNNKNAVVVASVDVLDENWWSTLVSTAVKAVATINTNTRTTSTSTSTQLCEQ